MDMNARNQYLKVLQRKYFMAKSRKEKSLILDEYCKNTHQNRKYIIRKIRSSISLVPKRRGGKEVIYDGYVKVALAKVWDIFDEPCGQRLAPLLKTEVDRLRQLMESEKIPEENKKELRNLYQRLNPAELKRKIDEKIHRLFKVYEEKQGGEKASPFKKQIPQVVAKSCLLNGTTTPASVT